MLAFLFYLLRLRRYKAKRVKTHCFLKGVGQFEPRFQGEGVVPGEYFWFLQTRHIFLSDTANCTVLRAVVLTQYRRVTDGIAIASYSACNAYIVVRCKNDSQTTKRGARRGRRARQGTDKNKDLEKGMGMDREKNLVS